MPEDTKKSFIHFHKEFSPFTRPAPPTTVTVPKAKPPASFYSALASLFGHEKVDPYMEAQVIQDGLTFDEEVDRNCGFLFGK